MFAVPKTVNVDGDMSEWADVEAIPITSRIDHVPAGSATMDAYIKIAYDNENLYFAIEAKDPVHYTVPSISYWNGDGVQFGVATGISGGTAVMKERGFSYYENEGGMYQTADDFTAKAIRKDGVTTYETALPWKSSFGNSVPEAILFTALVNDNNGMGREYNVELSPGISQFKDANSLRQLVIWSPVGSVLKGVSASKKLEVGEKGEASVHLKNVSTTPETVKVSIEALGVDEAVTIEAGEQKELIYDIVADKAENINLDVKLESRGETAVVNRKVTVNRVYTAENYPQLKAQVESYIPEVKELIVKCEEKGLSIPYERANFAILCKFVEYMDILHGIGQYVSMFEYEKTALKLRNETIAALNSYLAGEKEPMQVPKYITNEKLNFKGREIHAKTDLNGKIEERPVIFTGYGPWEAAAEEIPFFSEIGFNIIQVDFNIDFIIVQGQLEDWQQQISKNAKVELYKATEAATGDFSLGIKYPAASVPSNTMNVYKKINQKIECKPNTKYKYGLKAKGKGVTGIPYSVWFSVQGTSMSGRQTIPGSPDWTEYEFEYTTTAGQTELDCTILVERAVEEMYIDDVYVIEEGTNVNLLENPGFEKRFEPKTPLEKEIAELGAEINYDEVERLRAILESAEQNNVLVDVGLGVHYIPKFLLDADPTVTEATEYFIPYVVDRHPYIQKLLDIWMRVLAEAIVDYDSIHSVLLVNEPTLDANDGEHYIPRWIDFLKNNHGTIEVFNERYGTSYKSFEEIEMPLMEGPIYNEYMNMNEMLLCDWFLQDLAVEFKKLRPDINAYFKPMDYFVYNNSKTFKAGTNINTIAQFADINGCDSHSYYGNANTPQTLKMGWYDYMYSMADKPVWDTESHISNDKKIPEFDDVVAYYTSGEVWNGAIHGRSANVLWQWDLRRGSLPGGWANYPNANAVNRPADVPEVSKAALELQRLSKEVTALAGAERKVGMVFSRTTRALDDKYMNNCCPAYEEIIFTGQKVGFVSDESVELMHNHELLVVPYATYVEEKMLQNIKKYIENGGKVLILGENTLKYNEYGTLHDKAIVDYIYANSDTTSSVQDKIYEMNLSDVKLINAETGERPVNVEWCYTEYDGKMLVNIYNYDSVNTVPLKIMYNGKEISEFTELRTMEKITGSLQAKPYVPQLIQFSK